MLVIPVETIVGEGQEGGVGDVLRELVPFRFALHERGDLGHVKAGGSTNAVMTEGGVGARSARVGGSGRHWERAAFAPLHLSEGIGTLVGVGCLGGMRDIGRGVCGEERGLGGGRDEGVSARSRSDVEAA